MRVALSSVIADVLFVRVVLGLPVDIFAQSERLVMKKAVNESGQEAYVGLENNETPPRPQNAGKLSESVSRVFQMVENIEQYEIGERLLGLVDGVGVFHAIEPLVGKNVRRLTVRNVFLYQAEAGAQFQGGTGRLG